MSDIGTYQEQEQSLGVAERMFRLFQGNPRAHGTYTSTGQTPGKAKVEIKASARTVTTSGPTPELWKDHLEGHKPLGVIPIMPDNTCHWACIDIDDYTLSHVDIVKSLTEKKLPGIVCRSKSGGAHIFFFFSAPMPGELVISKLKGIVDDLGWPEKTEVFPKQVDANVGNWLNMPYFDAERGTRYAVREDGRGLSVEQFLRQAEITRISSSGFDALHVKEIAASHPQPTMSLRELTEEEKALIKQNGATEAALKELNVATARIIDTVEGSRNNRVFASSARVGELVGGGEINGSLAEQRLIIAALATGLPQEEAIQTVRNGLAAGTRNPRNTIAVDWKRAGILSRRIPFLADIDAAAQGSPEAREWVEKLVAKRKAFILSTVSIPPEAREKHQYEERTTLPDLTEQEYQGVILLRAPMGLGKTKSVGRRFADWAKNRPTKEIPDPLGDGVGTYKPGFIALCHRVTLTASLSNVLGIAHYKETDRQETNLATCLPSLKKARFAGIRAVCEYLFIDEVSQVLRFLASDINDRVIYDALKDVVGRAKCVIAADAGADARTVRFLEECRPGEVFRIIDVIPEQRSELDVEYLVHSGKGSGSEIWGLIDAELAARERIWISCESVKEAKALTEHLINQGREVLGIWAENKSYRDQEAFLINPEKESRKYEAIVHSPVISSGISIEHREDEHFTLGVFIGAGYTVTPADAAQMIRRVRYLKKVIVSLPEINNLNQRDSLEGLLKGQREAAKRSEMIVSSYDEFRAEVEVNEKDSQADFGNGLLWILEEMGAHIRRGDAATDAVLADERTARRQAEEATYIFGVQNAAIIDESRFNELKRAEGPTEQQQYEMEAFRIRDGLNLSELDDAAVAVWDHGRGVGAVDRLASVIGIEIPDSGEMTISKRKLWRQTREAYRVIFQNLTLAEAIRISSDQLQSIVDRVWDERFRMAHLGVVPVRWREDTKRRSAYLEAKDIFRRLGLTITTKRNRRAGTESYVLTGMDAIRHLATRRWATERWSGPVSGVTIIRELKKAARPTRPEQHPLPFPVTSPVNDNPAFWTEFAENLAPFQWMDISLADLPVFIRNDPDFWATAA